MRCLSLSLSVPEVVTWLALQPTSQESSQASNRSARGSGCSPSPCAMATACSVISCLHAAMLASCGAFTNGKKAPARNFRSTRSCSVPPRLVSACSTQRGQPRVAPTAAGDGHASCRRAGGMHRRRPCAGLPNQAEDSPLTAAAVHFASHTVSGIACHSQRKDTTGLLCPAS